MTVYKKYCSDILHCVFCNKCVNLYYAKAHLKTKKCQALKEMLTEDERNKLFLKFVQEINRLKSELSLGEESVS